MGFILSCLLSWFIMFLVSVQSGWATQLAENEQLEGLDNNRFFLISQSLKIWTGRPSACAVTENFWCKIKNKWLRTRSFAKYCMLHVLFSLAVPVCCCYFCITCFLFNLQLCGYLQAQIAAAADCGTSELHFGAAFTPTSS